MFFTIADLFKLYNYNNQQKQEKYFKVYKFIEKMCNNIEEEYIQRICSDKNNHILLYSINNELSKYSIKNEIIGFIIYRIILNTKDVKRIYISLFSIHPEMRNVGYGENILNEFIEKMRKEGQILELVLLSLPSSVNFYKKNDFFTTSNKFISNHEQIDDNIILMRKIY